MSKLYSFFTVLAFSFISSSTLYAQPQKGQFIHASAGLGICSPNEDIDLYGEGFYAQAEYVWSPYSWFGVRPYVGVIVASGESDNPALEGFSIKSNAALLGAKVRLVAPIPYVAPFIETGVGMSAGSFETYTPTTNLKKNGAILHIPFSMGLALGRRHNVELKFTYYFHDSVKQFSGAAAFGLTFPLDDNKE